MEIQERLTIVLFTIEVEYMATNHYTKKRFGLDNFWRIWDMCKNQGCIALAKNSIYHIHTKHIDVQHHIIRRKKLENQEICLKYCPTEDMKADVLTKPLAKDRHQALTRAINLEAFDYSQSGSI